MKHNAYTLSETEKKENQAEATLNVEYAPVPRDKPVQVHDLKIGETAVIPVSVEANPEPNSAEWKWGNETLAAGSSTKDGKLKSSTLEKGVSCRFFYFCKICICIRVNRLKWHIG